MIVIDVSNVKKIGCHYTLVYELLTLVNFDGIKNELPSLGVLKKSLVHLCETLSEPLR
jgi:hypothetical protein